MIGPVVKDHLLNGALLIGLEPIRLFDPVNNKELVIRSKKDEKDNELIRTIHQQLRFSQPLQREEEIDLMGKYVMKYRSHLRTLHDFKVRTAKDSTPYGRPELGKTEMSNGTLGEQENITQKEPEVGQMSTTEQDLKLSETEGEAEENTQLQIEDQEPDESISQTEQEKKESLQVEQKQGDDSQRDEGEDNTQTQESKENQNSQADLPMDHESEENDQK